MFNVRINHQSCCLEVFKQSRHCRKKAQTCDVWSCRFAPTGGFAYAMILFSFTFNLHSLYSVAMMYALRCTDAPTPVLFKSPATHNLFLETF